jgi:hypothetical protein
VPATFPKQFASLSRQMTQEITPFYLEAIKC